MLPNRPKEHTWGSSTATRGSESRQRPRGQQRDPHNQQHREAVGKSVPFITNVGPSAPSGLLLAR